jgi:hypothetical protein
VILIHIQLCGQVPFKLASNGGVPVVLDCIVGPVYGQ